MLKGKLEEAAHTCSIVLLSMPRPSFWDRMLWSRVFQEWPSEYMHRPPYSPFTDARVSVDPELYGPGYAWSSLMSPTCQAAQKRLSEKVRFLPIPHMQPLS